MRHVPSICRTTVLTLVLSADTASIAASQSSSLSVRIRAGDIGAMEVAAASDDRARISDLRAFLTGHHPQPSSQAVQAAHDALAMLDDVPELQSRWCRAVSISPAETNDRIEDLAIGGWFGVYSVSRFLLPEYRRRYWQAKAAFAGTHPRNDVMYAEIEVLTLQLLERLVPNPPVRWNPYDSGTDKALARAPIWLKWIDDNRAHLLKVRPTGEGVVFTLAACGER